jgi:hypothetical protein
MYIRVKQLSNAIPIRNLENANKAKVFEKAVIIPATDPIVLPTFDFLKIKIIFLLLLLLYRLLIYYAYTA